MVLPPLAIRRTLIAVTVFLLATSILWWSLWSIAAGRYRGVIDGWIESGRAAGYQIDYTDRKLFGFPRHVILRFTNLHWRNADGIDFHTGDIDIGATPWEWQEFNAKFKNYAEINTPLDQDGHSLILAGNEGSAHVTLNEDGYWKLSRMSLSGAKVGRAPDYLFLAEKLKFSAEKPDELPKSHKDTGLTLTGQADNVALPASMPSPFGFGMKNLTMDLRVMGDVPDFRKKSSVETWNKDSGVVEFDNLHMDWGSLILTAKGTMGFDDELQPEGAFSSAIGNQEQVLKALMDNGFIAARQEEMLNSALSLFAKPSKNDDFEGVEVPIAVQLGGLFLGPVKVYSFPEIVWPEAIPVSPAPVSPPAAAPP